MSPFEIIMLLCFGFSWPFSIYRTWTKKSSEGKSLLFLFLILVGYVSGVLHKIIFNLDHIVWLYALNGVMVAVDFGISLYFRMRSNRI